MRPLVAFKNFSSLSLSTSSPYIQFFGTVLLDNIEYCITGISKPQKEMFGFICTTHAFSGACPYAKWWAVNWASTFLLVWVEQKYRFLFAVLYPKSLLVWALWEGEFTQICLCNIEFDPSA